MKPNWWFDEMFKENYYFFIGWKPKAIEAYLKKNYKLERDFSRCDGRTMELTDHDGWSAQLIWTRYRSGPKFIPALAHECVHAAMHILDRRGVKLDVDNHEALSYMVEILMRKALA